MLSSGNALGLLARLLRLEVDGSQVEPLLHRIPASNVARRDLVLDLAQAYTLSTHADRTSNGNKDRTAYPFVVAVVVDLQPRIDVADFGL